MNNVINTISYYIFHRLHEIFADAYNTRKQINGINILKRTIRIKPLCQFMNRHGNATIG